MLPGEAERQVELGVALAGGVVELERPGLLGGPGEDGGLLEVADLGAARFLGLAPRRPGLAEADELVQLLLAADGRALPVVAEEESALGVEDEREAAAAAVGVPRV